MEFSHVTTLDSEEWDEWTGRNFEVHDGGIGLATEPRVSYSDLGFEALDVDIDRDENVFALRPTGDLNKYDEQREFAERVWTNEGDEAVEDPRALCVAGDRIYVADGETGDVVVVSDRLGEVVGRLDAGLEVPVDLVSGNRKIYVLDRGTGQTSGEVATLQRRGNVQTVLRGLESPEDLAVDDSGNVYVLEREEDGPLVSIYEARYVESPNAFPYRQTIEEFPVGEDDELDPSVVEALTEDELVINGRLSDGDPATVHYLSDGAGEGTFERRSGEDRLYSKLRRGTYAEGGRHPRYYGVGFEDDRVYAVRETKRHKRNSGGTLYDAQAFRRFDSGALDTEWHRITVDFESLPSNTQVRVSYFTSNDTQVVPNGVEAIESITDEEAVDLRVAGIEAIWDLIEHDPEEIADIVEYANVDRAEEWLDRAFDIVDEEWSDRWKSVRTSNPRDALLDGASGRFLHVRLEMIGEVETSPRIGAFRAYCPRKTYLRYLPEVFQGNGSSTAFLERFLSTFESGFVDIEEQIETITRYFDPEGVPSDYLPWLGQWLAIQFDRGWPESAKREFLARAPTLFKKRGTKEGLREILRLYLNHVDQPDTSWMLDWHRDRLRQRTEDGYLTEEELQVYLAELDELERGDEDGHLLFFFEHLDMDGMDSEEAKRPYTTNMHGERSFTVFAGPFNHRTQKRVVDRMTATERPAHTDYGVVELRQHCKLAGNSFLGINSTLTPRSFALGRSTLGGDTVLKEREPFS
ncbi:hypothetical protein BRD00_02825 [Halobacteriales archaeon QS_8_69_26]|nr:MAG: hypothetical protein BRD00_02825 [Halobacteriales archaeon QS_8_69_26]